MEKVNAKKEYLLLLLGAVITAVLCGGAGALFVHTLKFVNGVFWDFDFLVYLLPLGGLLTVWLFKTLKVEKQNIHTVFSTVKNDGKTPFLLSVAVFVGTVITQFFGGSSGKEGAALQIGSGIASPIAGFLKLKDEKLKILLLCGMTAMFSSVFTVPLTALAFGLEIIYISRKFYLKAVLPLTVSSFGAYGIARALGVHPERFGLPALPRFSAMSVLKVIALTVICSVGAMVFCLALHFTAKLFKKLFKNDYICIAVGGVLIIGLTLLVGNNDYNGGGMHIIENVLKTGTVCYWAFAFKIIFTAITNAAGYKGGEIVPALFVGATLGAAVGGLVGLPVSFAAAVGMVTLFCGATKCTAASLMLGLEFFGIFGAGYFALAAVLSRILTFNIGLYTEKPKKGLD